MNAPEAGFLLLTSWLGDPERKPLTVSQLRTLAARIRAAEAPAEDRELAVEDLLPLGYSRDAAQRIVKLLDERQVLEYYLSKGRKNGCNVLTRAGKSYPLAVRKRLGDDSPGSIWAKGDTSLLTTPMISLVGSRDLCTANMEFAAAVGREAALQGYTLVSGNARGADKTAQESCLAAGGNVICVVADNLGKHAQKDRVLYLSEDGFDCAFSSQRALSRNRIIHCLGQMTFVAQSALGTGGTWDGTVKNLQNRWSTVFCYDDGSNAAGELEMLGAHLIKEDRLTDFKKLYDENADLSIAL